VRGEGTSEEREKKGQHYRDYIDVGKEVRYHRAKGGKGGHVISAPRKRRRGRLFQGKGKKVIMFPGRKGRGKKRQDQRLGGEMAQWARTSLEFNPRGDGFLEYKYRTKKKVYYLARSHRIVSSGEREREDLILLDVGRAEDTA